MKKIVYNACYGGFNLSKEAVQRYFQIKNQQVWIEHDKKFRSLDMFTVWLTPPEERPTENKDFYSMSMDEISRHDPVLVQVVEELGEKANGLCANLQIAEVDGPYRIDEYDGLESVKTPDTYDWITP